MTHQWLKEKQELGATAKVVRSNKDLEMLDTSSTDYLFGLFGATHIRFGDTRIPEEDPRIIDMTVKAIEVH